MFLTVGQKKLNGEIKLKQQQTFFSIVLAFLILFCNILSAALRFFIEVLVRILGKRSMPDGET